MPTTRFTAACSLAAIMLVTGAQAHAQSYPERPVVVVVPYSAGGPTDVYGRLLATALSGALGQNFVVENRPGAATQVGATYVAAAANDGYTLLIANTTTLSLNPSLHTDLTYAIEDFDPIGLVSKIPIGFAVRADLPVNDIAEFKAYATENEAELTYGSAGTGSNSQMVNLLMNRTLGVDLLEIPYQGTAPALVELSAGHVDGLVDAMATLAPMHRDGRIRIIGNFDTERSSAVPDVATFVEQGVDITAFTWNALVAPAGTPENVVEVLNGALRQISENLEFRERLTEVGFSEMYSTQEELSAHIEQETRRWSDLIEDMNLREE